jgi:hypothetical protein
MQPSNMPYFMVIHRISFTSRNFSSRRVLQRMRYQMIAEKLIHLPQSLVLRLREKNIWHRTAMIPKMKKI